MTWGNLKKGDIATVVRGSKTREARVVSVGPKWITDDRGIRFCAYSGRSEYGCDGSIWARAELAKEIAKRTAWERLRLACPAWCPPHLTVADIEKAIAILEETK